MTVESSTETLISALRILSRDIQSEDGVANACLQEAADRMERYHVALIKIRKCYHDRPYGIGAVEMPLYCSNMARNAIEGING